MLEPIATYGCSFERVIHPHFKVLGTSGPAGHLGDAALNAGLHSASSLMPSERTVLRRSGHSSHSSGGGRLEEIDRLMCLPEELSTSPSAGVTLVSASQGITL